ncbi:MAG TPA: tol-pal system protein YbgF [Alphaproteobacteria bacterium]|jgi:tol-pal system protein YbgF|nr:tol-pal system protein YbgF [Micavibrio sp.]HQX27470.1 tol-pal system protein YbgF [Alphaproteobacteria bacterium]
MAVSGKSRNSMKAQIFLGLLASGVILASAPSFAQSNRDMSNRLNRIENELETLGRAVYKGEQPPAGVHSGGTSAADAEVRIQQFESQIREMTGRLEEQDNQIRVLREQLDKLSADLDVRLSGAQDGGSGGSFSNDSTTGGSFTNNPIRSTNTGGGTERGITPPPGDESGSGYQWNSGSNSSSMTDGQLGTLTDSGAGAAAGADSAASLYENAFSLLKGAQYNEAEKEFRSFLGQYPGHPLTGNATYWLGETYYVRGQFEKAAKTFAEGYQADPKGAKAADNLLKMGMSLSGMNKKNDACVALSQVEKQFASSGPVMRRAQQEMTRLGC